MFAKALLLGAFAAYAAAQSNVLTFTRVPNPITDGESQAITYATNDTDHDVTIILMKGPSHNLREIDTLTTTANGGQFIWTPPLSLPNGADYALKIEQGTQMNYFGPFTIQGAIPASVSAYASATAANATMTMTTTGGTISMGTGTTMPRNTTMVKPTINTKTTQTTETTTSGTMSPTTGSPSPASSSPGAASTDFNAGSSFALIFGALAAVFYLG